MGVQKIFNVIKDEEVLKGMPDGGDDLLWGYATVELPDSMDDIIRVAGMDYTSYHNPPETHMKVLAQHLKMLPDGSAPIVGRVERFYETTKEGVPALAFGMSWAKDPQGSLTPLAKTYSDLYQSGYLDSFSIGASAHERKPIKNGGYDYTKTQLNEISCVTCPANVNARVIRELGDYLDTGTLMMLELQQLKKQLEEFQQTVKEGQHLHLEKSESRFITMLEKKFDALDARLDFLESSIVVKAESKTHQPDNTKAGQDVSKQLKAIKDQIDRMK